MALVQDKYFGPCHLQLTSITEEDEQRLRFRNNFQSKPFWNLNR